METFLENLNAIWESLFQNLDAGNWKKDIIVGIILLIIAVIFTKTFWQKLANPFLFFTKRQIIIPRSLRHYKKTLIDNTLQLSHSWKLEGQTLKDLFIPINIIGESLQRIGLEDFFEALFTKTDTPRLLLLGDAGSGKTVAMGALARKTWDIARNGKEVLVPVMMKFSELKEVQLNTIERKIIENLERNQFEQGKRTQTAEEYVKNHLYKGDMLLIIDGLDELEKSKRLEVTKILQDFFETYPQIPFILSSRKAVWNQNPNLLSANLHFQLIEMAKLTSYEIRLFTTQWLFQGNKSGEQLATLITSKSYLNSIAVNPLMLTIISFLYAQPKRILPDNRVTFYTECIEALFEKWDNAKLLERANAFETHDKISILNRIAYTHITNVSTTDQEDISKAQILAIIGEEMKKLSRPVEKREQMLNEIEQNAELLIALPPNEYKFPHRTFTEYFAARYFWENDASELLRLYEKDAGKWEETLSLFCGINTNPSISDTILQSLKNLFLQTKDTAQPNVFMFRALVESAKINPAIAEEILDLGAMFLQKQLHPIVIEHIGYIAANENWIHAKKAKTILTNILRSNISNEALEKVITALAFNKDKEITDIIIDEAEKRDLIALLSKEGLGKAAQLSGVRLLERYATEKYEDVIQKIALNFNYSFLAAIILHSTKSEMKECAAYGLAHISDDGVFFAFLETIQLDKLEYPILEKLNRIYQEWGWHRNKVQSIEGRKFFFWIAELSANYIKRKQTYTFFIGQTINEETKKPLKILTWLKFLIHAYLVKMEVVIQEDNLIRLKGSIATLEGLRNYWKSVSYLQARMLALWIFLVTLILPLLGLFTHWWKFDTPFILGLVVLILFVFYLLFDNEKLNSLSLLVLLIVCIPVSLVCIIDITDLKLGIRRKNIILNFIILTAITTLLLFCIISSYFIKLCLLFKVVYTISTIVIYIASVLILYIDRFSSRLIIDNDIEYYLKDIKEKKEAPIAKK